MEKIETIQIEFNSHVLKFKKKGIHRSLLAETLHFNGSGSTRQAQRFSKKKT